MMFVHHHRQLKAGVLAKQVWDLQVREEWPGPAAETREICSSLGIEDVNSTKSTRMEWKREVKKTCKVKHEQEILEGMDRA